MQEIRQELSRVSLNKALSGKRARAEVIALMLGLLAVAAVAVFTSI